MVDGDMATKTEAIAIILFFFSHLLPGLQEAGEQLSFSVHDYNLVALQT